MERPRKAKTHVSGEKKKWNSFENYGGKKLKPRQKKS